MRRRQAAQPGQKRHCGIGVHQMNASVIESDVAVKAGIYSALEYKIRTRQARLGVVGLGYVGLPLGLTLSEAGFEVTGVDIDTNRVADIAVGRSYITDVSAQDLQRATKERRFRATADLTEIGRLD